jgi:protease-4
LDSDNTPWERKILEQLALQALVEQRRRRRWGIFFKLLGFAYLAVILGLVVDWGQADRLADGAKFTALVNLNGVTPMPNMSSALCKPPSTTSIPRESSCA